MRSILALEDGSTFVGTAFGAAGTRTGEACFNTSMTGYQEVLTDPSYRGQIVAMTYPLIGNYGVNAADGESANPHVRGFVVGELSPLPSNWRSEGTLSDYLVQHDIPGSEGVDTRRLTKLLRTAGAMRACLTTEHSADEAVDLARQSPSMEGMDYVREVSTTEAFTWDPDGRESEPWNVPNHSLASSGGSSLPPVKYRVVAFDFGIKRNILRRLRQHGFQVQVMPASTTAAEVLALDPDGIFLSNGPGDPAALDYIHKELRELVGQRPTFAICLGHQLVGHAFGARTFKLKFGHRGGNQPVQDLRSKQVAITSQNHGFAIDADSLPDCLEVTHVNLNDGTVEGLRHRELPVFSVQYHPEAAPGPSDAAYFFREFANLIDQSRAAR